MRVLVLSDRGYAIVFALVATAWWLPEVITLLKQRKSAVSTAQDRGSFGLLFALIWIGLFAGAGLAVVWPGPSLVASPVAAFWLGTGLMIAGIALRRWAIHVLGRHFTVTVVVRPGQAIVESGPYRRIRHPAYSGMLLVMCGIALTFNRWPAFVVIMAGGLISHLYRIQVEETALCATLGQTYRDYQRRTQRLVPFIW